MNAKAIVPAVAAGFLAVFTARVATTLIGTTPGSLTHTIVEGVAGAAGVLVAAKIVK